MEKSRKVNRNGEEEILKLLKKMKRKKTVGFSRIVVEFLKKEGKVMAKRPRILFSMF